MTTLAWILAVTACVTGAYLARHPGPIPERVAWFSVGLGACNLAALGGLALAAACR